MIEPVNDSSTNCFDIVPEFTATLLPHRSLPRKGFIVLMCAISLVSFIGGIAFMLMGAWPITGFFGLDVLLIYVAFRINYRSARLYEKIDLFERELKITRVQPSGKTQNWIFNPYWVRLQLDKREDRADELAILSHGRKLVFASFLSDSEKQSFAAKLQNALSVQKTPRFSA